MTAIDIERMSDAMTKFHLRGPWPLDPVIHHFADIDRGDPHDHPWGFRSIVLDGGYVERVFQPNGTSELVERKPGDSFDIAATHIHRMEALPSGDCWTLILPGPHERTSRFWQFREDGAYSRAWHEAEWTREWK
jgi:hypothetical protein